MLAIIKNKVLQIEKAGGIEICLLSEDNIAVNMATVRIKKGKLIKESEYHFLPDYDALAKKFDVNIPVAVSLSGKGVLLKKIEAEEISGNPIEMVLPTANPDEFYVEVIGLEEIKFIAIIRKELLNKIVSKLQQNGFQILSVSLFGIADAAFFFSVLKPKDKLFQTSSYLFRLNEQNQISEIIQQTADNINPSGLEYNIGDQYVHSPSLIPFCSASVLLIASLNRKPTLVIEQIEKGRKNYGYFKWYKASLWIVLLGFLSILLINFFIYSYYFSKNNEMQINQAFTKEKLDRINSLALRIKEKEKFLAATGWNSPFRLSFFADRISALVPGSILLTHMQIQPVRNGDFIENEMTSFRKDTIEIVGSCEDPTEIGSFLGNIKTMEACKSVNIKNYTFKKEANIGIFSIEIIMH
jgi:hypothetical protein